MVSKRTLGWWIIVFFKTLFWVNTYWCCIFEFLITISLSHYYSFDLILFELILSYFGSDNWIWIRNLKLKTLVEKRKRKETYQIDLVWSTLVYPVNFGPFDLLRSVWANFVHFGSFWSNLVYFGLFRPHMSNSVYSVHSVHFSPFGQIRSISAHFSPFGPIQYT